MKRNVFLWVTPFPGEFGVDAAAYTALDQADVRVSWFLIKTSQLFFSVVHFQV